MTHASLKTKITLLFPLATTLLVALLLAVSQNNFWNIAFRYPAQEVPLSPTCQQLNSYVSTIPLLLLFFVIMRFLLIRMTTSLFPERAECREVHESSIDMAHSRENGHVCSPSDTTEKPGETMPQLAKQISPPSVEENTSAIKLMENHLLYAQKMGSIGQLTNSIAHDFNNILTAIIGYSNILMMKLPAESPFAVTTEQILAAAERGAGLTQGLLTFSRKQISNLIQINLNAIIEHVEKLLRHLIGNKSIFTSTLATRQLMVLADHMQIAQVLINLTTVIRDSMPTGGTITITTELVDLDANFCSFHGINEKGRYALLSISGAGASIDNDRIRGCLDPIFPTNEYNKETESGFSIINSIIKKHNGHIICNNESNQKTFFRIYLPIWDETACRSPDPVTLPGNPPNRTILLADNDKTSSTFTKDFLKEFGYSVIEAMDADMVLDKYQEHSGSIRLVIIDGIITGPSGARIFRKIKDAISLDRIVLCGDPQDSTIKQLISLNRNLRFIAKPFSPKELLMNVSEVIQDAS